MAILAGLLVAQTAMPHGGSAWAQSAAEDAARAVSPTSAGDLPPLPALDPALNTDEGMGRTAAAVRQRVLVNVRQLFSPMEGDRIATDGPILAEEMGKGGTRVTFPDLSIRTGTLSGDPTLVVFGDVVAEATAGADGGIEYTASLSGPITFFSKGEQIADLAFDRLTMNGAFDAEAPLLGEDTIAAKGVTLTVPADVGDPTVVTAEIVDLNGRAASDGDGTIGSTYTARAVSVGIRQGEGEPTVNIERIGGTLSGSGTPEAWLEGGRLTALGERFPRPEQVVETTSRLLGTQPLGKMVAAAELTGIEIHGSPTESVSIDRIGLDMAADEPASGTPSGAFGIALDTMRSQGDLPVAVDLGALRMSIKGQDLDVARLRGHMADVLTALGPAIATPGAAPADLPPEQEQALLAALVGVMKDVALGEGDSRMVLSGLDVRDRGRTMFGLDTFEMTAGWAEDDQGRLSGPSRLALAGLRVDDPQGGMPVRVGRLDIDSATEGFDLAAYREMVAALIEQSVATGLPPDPMTMTLPNKQQAVAGGSMTMTLEDVALGNKMNPMGGLSGLTLTYTMEAAEPGVDAVGADLSLDIRGLDTGPMTALVVPLELVPTDATLAVTGQRLPIPALARLSMGNPAAGGRDPERVAEALLAKHRPAFTVDTLTVGGPIYGIEGNGDITVAGSAMPDSQGAFNLTVTGLDETMALLQEQVQIDPSLQQPLLALVALRGLGRADEPGTYRYEVALAPDTGVVINGTPAAALMVGPQPGTTPPASPGMVEPPSTESPESGGAPSQGGAGEVRKSR
ncbi:hypothetical protein [Roseospira marina]|uniref:hypothetical protein n=1 Tax=Roseospira marina TaxID=140057 RepID=UPI00161D1BD9|nr:hypothetical protein [Roseospira marina]MBB4314856.1 hypothetical protein [Roseospira marina]MBB5087856.1 hypothetical protein [Roseospira marina]